MQAFSHLSGAISSIEHAVIGRRTCEVEWDLLELLDQDACWRPAEPDPQPAPPTLHDRPTMVELLDAARSALGDNVLPQLQGRPAFETRVTMRALGIIRRELMLADDHAARRAEVMRALGVGSESELAARIRGGAFDGREAELLGPLRALVEIEGRGCQPPLHRQPNRLQKGVTMTTDVPDELAEVIAEIDDFIEHEVRPLERDGDNARFFDHRREHARTDFERGGIPSAAWEALLEEMMKRADRAGLWRYALATELGGRGASNYEMAVVREHLNRLGIGLHNDPQSEGPTVSSFGASSGVQPPSLTAAITWRSPISSRWRAIARTGWRARRPTVRCRRAAGSAIRGTCHSSTSIGITAATGSPKAARRSSCGRSVTSCSRGDLWFPGRPYRTRIRDFGKMPTTGSYRGSGAAPAVRRRRMRRLGYSRSKGCYGERGIASVLHTVLP